MFKGLNGYNEGFIGYNEEFIGLIFICLVIANNWNLYSIITINFVESFSFVNVFNSLRLYQFS